MATVPAVKPWKDRPGAGASLAWEAWASEGASEGAFAGASADRPEDREGAEDEACPQAGEEAWARWVDEEPSHSSAEAAV